MLIALADGVPVADGEAAVQRVADRFGAPDVQTNQEFTETIPGEISLYLTVIYVLLILAVVIAVRASPTPCRCRSTNAPASSACCGPWARPGARPGRWYEARHSPWACSEGFGSFAVPKLPLAVVLALGALVGVLAAARPTHRAARMKVPSAIATE